MSTLQARLLLVAFVGLSAAITYNAISLQKGSHHTPMVIGGYSADNRTTRTASRTAKIPRAPAQKDKTSAVPTRSQRILTIQRNLAENGYEPGPVDGVLGVMTRASIMAYQHDHGLRVTGIASNRLLKRMILGESIGDDDLDVSSAVPLETVALVKVVQMALTNLKYKPGPADGIFGAATRSAIESFERDHKMTVKGRISAKLLKELTQTSGMRFSELDSG